MSSKQHRWSIVVVSGRASRDDAAVSCDALAKAVTVVALEYAGVACGAVGRATATFEPRVSAETFHAIASVTAGPPSGPGVGAAGAL